jgi:hypothetical protein
VIRRLIGSHCLLCSVVELEQQSLVRISLVATRHGLGCGKMQRSFDYSSFHSPIPSPSRTRRKQHRIMSSSPQDLIHRAVRPGLVCLPSSRHVAEPPCGPEGDHAGRPAVRGDDRQYPRRLCQGPRGAAGRSDRKASRRHGLVLGRTSGWCSPVISSTHQGPGAGRRIIGLASG